MCIVGLNYDLRLLLSFRRMEIIYSPAVRIYHRNSRFYQSLAIRIKIAIQSNTSLDLETHWFVLWFSFTLFWCCHLTLSTVNGVGSINKWQLLFGNKRLNILHNGILNRKCNKFRFKFNLKNGYMKDNKSKRSLLFLEIFANRSQPISTSSLRRSNLILLKHLRGLQQWMKCNMR